MNNRLGSSDGAFWNAADRYLRFVVYGVATALLLLTLFSIGFLASRSNHTETLNSQNAQFLLDTENSISIPRAINEFLSSRGTPLAKAGSIPFTTIWLYFEVQNNDHDGDLIEIESIRTEHADFWAIDRKSGQVLGRVKWKKTQNGIALTPESKSLAPLAILGRIQLISINRARIHIESEDQSKEKELNFERKGGLLFGAFLMVGIFSYIVSFFYKDLIFFLFGTWLLTTLRITAYNGNWDLYWLEIPIPNELLQLFLRITYIIHSFVSLALFYSLFKTELRKVKLDRLVLALQIATISALVPSILLNPSSSLRLLWLLSGCTIISILYTLYALIRSSLSRELLWYSSSWLITLFGAIVQILYSLGLRQAPIELANSQSFALASALLLAVTLAERMNSDKAERITAQNSAISTLQRYRQNYNVTPIGICSINSLWGIVEHNPAFGSIFNETLAPESLIGEDARSLLGEDVLNSIASGLSSNRVIDREFTRLGLGRKPRWFHIRAFRKSDRYEIWIEDISHRKEVEAQLQFLVNHDPLTGILNRRGVELALEAATQQAVDRVMCLAYIDLDRFKLVNDLFGHATGDQILQQMASRLRTVVSAPHVAARVGGDEFILIIDSLPLDEARSLCERLRTVLSSQPYHYQDKAFTVSASIGLIRILAGMTAADALTASDRACAEAKRTGGRSVVCFDSGSTELSDYLEEIRIVAQIKERLPIENFFLVFQPIISMRQPDAGLSYEALIRMRDASGAVQPPARFIPAAERNGLMTQIDRWVLRDMLEWLDEHPAHRDRLDFCTVNLSGASLNDEKFLQDTIALIREHSRASRKVCFEITESVALYDLNTTRRFVDSVKFLGSKVALDDFGAGYTSFSYLKEIPADFVKIDGNFIRNIDSIPANYAIAQAIVELTRKLGMACIAEWAENDDIIQSLIDLQVDYAQGFGLCGAVDREKILATRNGITLIRSRPTTRLVLNAAITQSRRARRNLLPPLTS